MNSLFSSVEELTPNGEGPISLVLREIHRLLPNEVVDIAIRTGALMQVPSSMRYSEDIRSVVIYGLIKSAEFEEQVRQKAMANAKEKAQKLAVLAGKSIGEVVRIGCSGTESWGIPMRIIPPGKVKASKTVTP